MATMEVSIERYNAMLDKMRNLEDNLVTLNKKNKKLHIEVENLKENIEICKNVNWVDRVFKWKQILNLISTSETAEHGV